MSKLLETYRSRFASDDVRLQGNAYNGPCPFCGGVSSGNKRSDRFIVWPEKDENLGETCKDHRIPGAWFCRQCKKSGDTIAFLMEAEGMTFKSACAELGVTTTRKRPPARRTPVPPLIAKPVYTPREWAITAEDADKWRAYAEKLHAESLENLHRNPSAIAWLEARGLDRAALTKYKIGYLPGENGKNGRFRHRSALGLAPKKRADGSDMPYIFIPRGIVIPHFDQSGRLGRIRIRRPKPDIKPQKPKYIVLEGSNMQPLLLPSSAAPQLAAYGVAEAELDAMLIHYHSGGIVGGFAALTNTGKPDASQHAVLQQAAAILVSTDYDPRAVTRPDGTEAIESPGANGAAWWTDTYKQAKRWPTPTSKDPGDAYKEGLNIVAWLCAGLPASINLPLQTAPDAGRMEAFPIGMNTGGEGEPQKEGVLEEVASSMHTNDKNSIVPHHETPHREAAPETGSILPEGIPAAVRELFYAWAMIPGFCVLKRLDGSIGFRCFDTWARESEENWKAVCTLQASIMDDATLWWWVMNNPSAEVDLENFFDQKQRQ